jgi:hypothetical protein
VNSVHNIIDAPKVEILFFVLPVLPDSTDGAVSLRQGCIDFSLPNLFHLKTALLFACLVHPCSKRFNVDSVPLAVFAQAVAEIFHSRRQMLCFRYSFSRSPFRIGKRQSVIFARSTHCIPFFWRYPHIEKICKPSHESKGYAKKLCLHLEGAEDAQNIAPPVPGSQANESALRCSGCRCGRFAAAPARFADNPKVDAIGYVCRLAPCSTIEYDSARLRGRAGLPFPAGDLQQRFRCLVACGV